MTLLIITIITIYILLSLIRTGIIILRSMMRAIQKFTWLFGIALVVVFFRYPDTSIEIIHFLSHSIIWLIKSLIQAILQAPAPPN